MARKKEKRPFWLLLRPGKSNPSGAKKKNTICNHTSIPYSFIVLSTEGHLSFYR